MHFLLGSSATIVWVQRVKARPCGKRATVHEHSLKMEEGEGGSWFLLQGKDADLLGASKKAPAHTSSVNVSAEDHMIAQCFWEAAIPPLFSSFFFFFEQVWTAGRFFQQEQTISASKAHDSRRPGESHATWHTQGKEPQKKNSVHFE